MQHKFSMYFVNQKGCILLVSIHMTFWKAKLQGQKINQRLAADWKGVGEVTDYKDRHTGELLKK